MALLLLLHSVHSASVDTFLPDRLPVPYLAQDHLSKRLHKRMDNEISTKLGLRVPCTTDARNVLDWVERRGSPLALVDYSPRSHGSASVPKFKPCMKRDQLWEWSIDQGYFKHEIKLDIAVQPTSPTKHRIIKCLPSEDTRIYSTSIA